MEERLLMLISKQLEELTEMFAKQQKTTWGKMGRPTKEHVVIRYRESYPNDGKMQCVRATGLSPKTVNKYWDLYTEQKEEAKETLLKQA